LLFVAGVFAEVVKARVDVPDCGQGEVGELPARLDVASCDDASRLDPAT
jgi:hypothetical protein